MKFKFCSDGDCPLWALAALHALASLPVQLFRRLVDAIADGQNDDEIMVVLKDTSLASREESARAAAVVRWVWQQTVASSCAPSQLTRDLLVLGLPRAHATVLSEVAGKEDFGDKVDRSGLDNPVTSVSASEAPIDDAIKLTIQTDNTILSTQEKHDIIIEKSQVKVLLEELKKAYKVMEELDA